MTVEGSIELFVFRVFYCRLLVCCLCILRFCVFLVVLTVKYAAVLTPSVYRNYLKQSKEIKPIIIEFFSKSHPLSS